MEVITTLIKNLLSLRVLGSIELLGAGVAFGAAVIVFLCVVYVRKRIHPLRRAERLYDRGNQKKTLFFLALALKKNPFDKKAIRLRADIAVKLEQFAEASRDYFQLLYLKTPGDGVDSFEVKQCLLLPLYRLESLLELHTFCRELLNREKDNPRALYYLALLFMGQRYYREAAHCLGTLIRNRPTFHEGLFSYAAAILQEKRLEEANTYMKKALEISDALLYRLGMATVLYLAGNFIDCSAVLGSLPLDASGFESRRQYLFALKLGTFCCYRRGKHAEAVELFRRRYEAGQQKELPEKPDALVSKIGLYDERGRIRAGGDREKHRVKTKTPSTFENYYRLIEVALEEGLVNVWRAFLPPQKRILDLEGFSPSTEAAVDLAFSMVRAGLLEEAGNFLEKIRKDHPELLGLGKLINMVQERRMSPGGDGIGSSSSEAKLRESTERIIRKKKRRYELWEYLEEWERGAIKPYELLMVGGFTSRKQLSSAVLFGRENKV